MKKEKETLKEAVVNTINVVKTAIVYPFSLDNSLAYAGGGGCKCHCNCNCQCEKGM